MRRIFWIAVGAVGGIYAYRHGERLRAQLERDGLLRTAQSIGDDAIAVVATTRSMIERARTLLLGAPAPATVTVVTMREQQATWPSAPVTVSADSPMPSAPPPAPPAAAASSEPATSRARKAAPKKAAAKKISPKPTQPKQAEPDAS